MEPTIDNDLAENVDNQASKIKLYSQSAIALATYLGGPIASGILIRKNYINLGRAEAGKNALLISAIGTVLLFGGFYFVPEDVIDKIPNFLVPAIYTGAIYLIVERILGDKLKEHKETEQPFYSRWKAAGVGGICLAGIVVSLFAVAYMTPEDFDTNQYNNYLAEFGENETQANKLYDILDSDAVEVADYIYNVSLPNWKENISVVEKMNSIEGLTPEFIKQNEVLLEYCHLRVEVNELMLTAMRENTSEYDSQIIELHNEIDELLEEL